MRALSCLLYIVLLIHSTLAIAQPVSQSGPADPGASANDIHALIQILDDEVARARLIESLQAAAQDASANGSGIIDPTLAHQVADQTRRIAQDAAGLVGTIVDLGGEIVALFSGATTIDTGALWHVVRNVALVVAVTFAVYVGLRLALHHLQQRYARGVPRRGLLRRLGLIAATTTGQAAVVMVAWSAGYVVGLNVDQAGVMGINRALFLNAFLFIELAKVAVRTLLMPGWPTLRSGWLDDTAAAYWYFWLSRFLSVAGYTFLFAAPILAENVSIDAAEALRILVMASTLVMATIVILQNRDTVRERLTRRVKDGRSDALSRSLAAPARIWHIVAIGYLVGIFTLWLADRETALPFVLSATFQSVIAIVIGISLTTLIARLASGGMHLPPDVRHRLPLLEQRLNAFVPNVLRVVRLVVTVAVVLTIAQVWQIADFYGWLSSELGQRVATSVVSAVLILVVGWLIYLAVQSWVEYRLNPNHGRVPTSRERTLLSLFRNAFTTVLAILLGMLVLSELGVNIGPLLAGAGVVGLAVGFGAQKLVQDVITGVFIQFENAMNEGDVVTAAGITGTVERLTIRSVSLRTLDGAYHLVPFSSVDTVSNFTKHFSYHLAEIGVAYRESIPEVKQAMVDAFERLKETESGAQIVGELEMHGVTDLADSAVIVRARIKTMPGQQWALGRAYNEIVKAVFDERGIEIPYPHMTLYMGQDKKGKAPPIHIEQTTAEDPGIETPHPVGTS